MRGSKRFCQRESNSFCFDEGRSSFKYASGSMMDNIECFLGSFLTFQWIRTSIAYKTLKLCDCFRQGVGVRNPCPSPRIAHAIAKLFVPDILTISHVKCVDPEGFVSGRGMLSSDNVSVMKGEGS